VLYFVTEASSTTPEITKKSTINQRFIPLFRGFFGAPVEHLSHPPLMKHEKPAAKLLTSYDKHEEEPGLKDRSETTCLSYIQAAAPLCCRYRRSVRSTLEYPATKRQRFGHLRMPLGANGLPPILKI
jgi:hypothetical protein